MEIYESRTTYKKVGEVPSATTIDGPAGAVNYMRGAFRQFPLQEQVWVLQLSRKHHIASREMVALGTHNACMVEAAVIFRPAILQGSDSIIVVHNHPSGIPDPSPSDIKLCNKLIECGKIMGIPLRDFIIIGHNDYWSADDKGLV